MTAHTETQPSAPQGGDTLVRFIDVGKTYDGEVLAVRDLNLDIHKGEFITLLGPSGSGKTTMLMMLAGFEAPTHGDILLSGRTLRNVPPHRRNIGVVFQNYALFPHMTVAENLAFPLAARRIPKSQQHEKVERALAMVELSGFDTRRPGQLSGGQQQRVALARALVFEPELVLMDEPLGALDKQLREQMQLQIKHIHEDVGITVVYVTHDQTEALTMSNRVAVLNQGRIEQLGAPTALYEEPENAFVAQFIGENNRFVGRVSALDPPYCTVALAGGEIIEALIVNPAGVGRPTTLSLRPESVAIAPADGEYSNRFSAVVEEIIYLGDHKRIRVNVCGNRDFIIKIPRTRSAPRFDVGSSMEIGWHREDCRALDAS
ncbi:MAG: ABC transporter ATP-binding protein [Proteobacteria bacterium]|nr:ABC transporter ATP-binding protein [Pseudomonadota bacterium]